MSKKGKPAANGMMTVFNDKPDDRGMTGSSLKWWLQLGETSAVTKHCFVRVERVVTLVTRGNSPLRVNMKAQLEMVAPAGLEPATDRL